MHDDVICRYGVIAFDGEQLWQGQNDATVITLVKEHHDGITIKRRRRSALNRVKTSNNATGGGFGQVRCPVWLFLGRLF